MMGMDADLPILVPSDPFHPRDEKGRITFLLQFRLLCRNRSDQLPDLVRVLLGEFERIDPVFRWRSDFSITLPTSQNVFPVKKGESLSLDLLLRTSDRGRNDLTLLIQCDNDAFACEDNRNIVFDEVSNVTESVTFTVSSTVTPGTIVLVFIVLQKTDEKNEDFEETKDWDSVDLYLVVTDGATDVDQPQLEMSTFDFDDCTGHVDEETCAEHSWTLELRATDSTGISQVRFARDGKEEHLKLPSDGGLMTEWVSSHPLHGTCCNKTLEVSVVDGAGNVETRLISVARAALEPESEANLALIFGVVGAVLLLLMIIIAVGIFFWKRKIQKKEDLSDKQDDDAAFS
ncbi:unnamed protein product [Cyprideis torosa]|uniref:Uncharacterized protein n=1 Tax=Cyprideis torosa TaxID=163714 RepID=A0A7R8ZNP7_9CRUS|nr:unnamed protein product [Cyprideis torosa]CAG0886823.1 unnamed protein product [Cyprideis torosa]